MKQVVGNVKDDKRRKTDMSKVLVINAGSSSLKYQLIDMTDRSVLAKGLAERIGIDSPKISYKAGETKVEKDADMKNHDDAIGFVLGFLTDPEIGVVKGMDEIVAVGHRAVHGGEKFNKSAIITEEVMDTIESLIELAPLHNPAVIMGIRACQKAMPTTPMVTVFDTAFHQTMPPIAYLYGLPYEDYQEYAIRRYGFHGTSHRYVSARVAAQLGRPIEELKIVTCHLGNGSSICAVDGGKSVDTSMGFTPLEGVIMGTRSGNLDPAIVSYLAAKKGFGFKEIDNYLNKKSGILGLSGISSDFRDVEAAAIAGDERANTARATCAYGIKKYVGAYAAAMGGLDAVVFTAGVGENDPYIRGLVCKNLQFLGIDFDAEFNMKAPRGQEICLTRPGSKVSAWVIPTDEEMVIAQDTYDLCGK